MLTQRATSTVLESQKSGNGQSFKEALKEAWGQKLPIMEQAKSPETMNYCGMIGYFLGMSFVCCTSMFYLIPANCPSEDSSSAKLFLWVLVLMNASASNINWLLCAERKSQFLKESTIPAEERQKLAASSYPPAGYRYCTKCQLYAPPRAYHCHLCHSCVLKRDYHCYITGSCVGFTSQRRYLPYCFHISVGGLIHMLISLYFLNSRMPLLDDFYVYFPVVTVIRFMTGELSFTDLFFMSYMYACMAIMVVAWCYLMWEWLMVIRGQTSYEATRSIQTYRLGAFKNLYLVFGRAWFLNFIFPMPTMIPSDGVNWERRSQQKAH